MTIYSLSKKEIKEILKILEKTDFEKLRKEYTVQMTDQPCSKIALYTNHHKFVIDDYGLEGDYPLQELYKLVYQLKSH